MKKRRKIEKKKMMNEINYRGDFDTKEVLLDRGAWAIFQKYLPNSRLWNYYIINFLELNRSFTITILLGTNVNEDNK